MEQVEQIAWEISSRLRAYQGAQDLGRIRSCPVLLDALGTADPSEAFKRLKAVIAALGQSRDILALANAMNVKPVRDGDATQRRKRFAELNGRVSVSAVKQWEARGIRALARHLAIDTKASAQLVDVLISGDIHDCDLRSAQVTRTFKTATGEIIRDTVSLEADTKFRWRILMFELGPDESPESLAIVLNWSGGVPGHHWVYEYPSVMHVGLGLHDSALHYADEDHSPMPAQTRRQVVTPKAGFVYAAWWPEPLT